MRIALTLSTAMLLLISQTATSQDYFPLQESLFWQYSYTTQSESGNHTTEFIGTIQVNGTTAHVLHYFGGVDDGLRQYWSNAPDGDKLFHGFLLSSNFQIIWSPPITMIDMPVSLGKAWEIHSTGSGGEMADLQFEVVSLDMVTVPAGTYPAVTIQNAFLLPGSAFAVFGTKATSNPGAVVATLAPDQDSYADGVGKLRSESGLRTDELISTGIVAVEEVTWSRIRSLYR